MPDDDILPDVPETSDDIELEAEDIVTLADEAAEEPDEEDLPLPPIQEAPASRSFAPASWLSNLTGRKKTDDDETTEDDVVDVEEEITTPTVDEPEANEPFAGHSLSDFEEPEEDTLAGHRLSDFEVDDETSDEPTADEPVETAELTIDEAIDQITSGETDLETAATKMGKGFDKRALYEALKSQIEAEEAAANLTPEVPPTDNVVPLNAEPEQQAKAEEAPDDDALLATFRAQLQEEDNLERTTAKCKKVEDDDSDKGPPEELIGRRARSPNMSALSDTLRGRVPMTEEERKMQLPRIRFRRGFILTLVLISLLTLLYAAGGLIAARFPAMAGFIEAYVNAMNYLSRTAYSIGSYVWSWIVVGFDWVMAKISGA